MQNNLIVASEKLKQKEEQLLCCSLTNLKNAVK